MAKQTTTSETELAKIVVAWLETNGWEVFKEVKSAIGSCIADIVARKEGKIWVIECKQSLGLAVMRQAHHWLPYATQVSVAVPSITAGNKDRQFANTLLHILGIGHISIQYNYRGQPSVCEVSQSVENSGSRISVFNSVLCEGHKTFAEAGNAKGKHWSPFQQTVLNIKEYLSTHNGSSLDTILENVTTHYASKASAKNALIQLYLKKTLKGIRAEMIGRTWKLYLVPEKPEPVNLTEKYKRRGKNYV